MAIFAAQYFKMINIYTQSIKNTGDAYQGVGNFEKSLQNYKLAKHILLANFEGVGHEEPLLILGVDRDHCEKFKKFVVVELCGYHSSIQVGKFFKELVKCIYNIGLKKKYLDVSDLGYVLKR
jgi:hypothetical protein